MATSSPETCAFTGMEAKDSTLPMGRSWMGTSLLAAVAAVTGTAGMPCGGASWEPQATDIKDTTPTREICSANRRLRGKNDLWWILQPVYLAFWRNQFNL